MTNETRSALLEVAEELVQTRGFNAFSFRDLSERVGIRTASIHYHFPTKADLGLALIAGQRERVRQALEAIDAAGGPAPARLRSYADVFLGTLRNGHRMCLCGMLAADAETLSEAMLRELQMSFEEHETWLDGVMAEGRSARTLAFPGSPRDRARLFLAALEGGMLVARTFHDVPRLEGLALSLLDDLAATPGD
jgi:TetR/AcrR family transcriptional repressor of nem operon